MSLQTQLSNLVLRIGTEFKSVRASVGNLAGLSTTAKDSIVNSINDIQSQLNELTQIDDTLATGATTYSSSKIESLLAILKSDLLGGASSAFDTLKELQDLIESDAAGIASLTSAIGNRVRFDAAQSITMEQKLTARTNIGAASSDDLATLSNAVGDTSADFVTTFNNALV